MRKMVWAAVLICGMVGCAAHAQNEGKMVGKWYVITKADRFGEGGTFIAATGDGVGGILAVRCIEKEWSVAISDTGIQGALTTGDTFDVKLRVDTLPIVKTKGLAINEKFVQLVTTTDLVKSIRDGNETAVRTTSPTGITSTNVFKNTGAPKAFAPFTKDCPLE